MELSLTKVIQISISFVIGYFRAQNPIPLQLHTVEASFLRMWTISSFNSEMMPDSAALLQGILNGFDDILVDSSAPRAVASMDSDGLAWELLLVTRCFFRDVWGPLMGGLHASQLCWDVFVVLTCFKFDWLQIRIPSLHMLNSGKPSYGSGKPLSLQLNPIHADVVLGNDLSWLGFFWVLGSNTNCLKKNTLEGDHQAYHQEYPMIFV